MGPRQREVVWTVQARLALDEAVAYVAQDSPAAAIRLLEPALDAGASLRSLAERGRWCQRWSTHSLEKCSYSAIVSCMRLQKRTLEFLLSCTALVILRGGKPVIRKRSQRAQADTAPEWLALAGSNSQSFRGI